VALGGAGASDVVGAPGLVSRQSAALHVCWVRGKRSYGIGQRTLLTERKEVKVEDPWKKLTPDQMEEFARTGDLPASVDVEQLFGKN
jgi:hypothetical protein